MAKPHCLSNDNYLQLNLITCMTTILGLGFQPFVDVCLKHNNQAEAQKYMPKVREELREKYITKLG